MKIYYELKGVEVFKLPSERHFDEWNIYMMKITIDVFGGFFMYGNLSINFFL